MLSQPFKDFARALTDPGAALPAGLRSPDGTQLADRFGVYRNNVCASLIAALAARFPVCHALVGPEFFQAMAREYVARQRPSGPLLHEYGAGFPDFIGTFEPAASLPFLPDMARLEGLWTQCWGAAEAPVIDPVEMAGLDPEVLLESRVQLHPAARLLRSAYPIAGLWTLHQAPDPDLSGLSWEPENVLLTRPHATIQLRRIDSGVATFAAALAGGSRIAASTEAALADSPGFELGTALLGLLKDGYITGLSP